MRLSRRRFVGLASVFATMQALPARPQTYPARPVRIVVGTAAGGAPDIVARLMAQWLSDRLGQPFLVENRPGAGSNIATEAVARAAADGHTLLLVAAPQVINTTLYHNLSFDFRRDIAPIASIMSVPLVMQVGMSVPVKTVPEFIGHAKANSGRISFASAGNGTSTHVAGELFRMMTGIEMVHVPYRGGAPAQSDLIAGQVQVGFFAAPDSIELVKSGKLRALAVTSSARSHVLPDVPTIDESVSGYEASTWFGIGAPANVPAEIVARLNREINASIADPTFKGRLTELGGTPLLGSPADFRRFIIEETEKWARVVKAAGLRPD